MTLEQISRKPRIAELLEAKQDEMEAALSANRRIMPHEGEKGAATELRWRDMLSRYLPRRYSVASGFVVDNEDGVSEQIDIIIHDAQYSPFLFQAGSSCFVPAESVYAVFDAKQELTQASIAQTGAKVASVRRLSRTSGKVYTNHGVYEGKNPADQPILGGVLAITSKWKIPFGIGFERALRRLPEGHHLNLGVALSHGAFEVGTPPDDDIIVYDRSTALVGFFMALIRTLQPLATALAMDLDVWSKRLRDGV